MTLHRDDLLPPFQVSGCVNINIQGDWGGLKICALVCVCFQFGFAFAFLSNKLATSAAKLPTYALVRDQRNVSFGYFSAATEINTCRALQRRTTRSLARYLYPYLYLYPYHSPHISDHPFLFLFLCGTHVSSAIEVGDAAKSAWASLKDSREGVVRPG